MTQNSIIIQIKLDMEKATDLCIHLTPNDVINAIIAQVKSEKLTPNDFQTIEGRIIQVHSLLCPPLQLAHRMTQFLENLRKVIVYGIAGCEADVSEYKYSQMVKSEMYKQFQANRHDFDPEITQEPLQDQQYCIMTTTPAKPYAIFNNPLINPYLTYTSSVHMTSQMFGIEAARQLILDEVFNLYHDYGMNVCNFHVQILASFMTTTGQVLGYTNQGLKQVKKNKTILLVSFERTGEYLFQAGIQGIHEAFNEVSEDLIFGNCFQIGSGGMSLQWNNFEASTGEDW